MQAFKREIIRFVRVADDSEPYVSENYFIFTSAGGSIISLHVLLPQEKINSIRDKAEARFTAAEQNDRLHIMPDTQNLNIKTLE